jgi:aspartate aminotransferase-like enzyme
MKRGQLLLTPGPTPVPPELLRALARPLFHHRTSQYQKLFKEVSEGLQRIFKTRHPVYTFTASGTGAMEAALVNFHSPGDELLVVEAGKFGERFWRIAKAYGLKPQILKVENGETVSPEDVERAVARNVNLKSICLQLCETSTGVTFDLEEIGKRLRGKSPLVIVDAISGLGADRFEMEAWGVDLAISGSQKGLMLPPGLAFLGVSPRAKERMKEAGLPRFYFDLALYEKALGQWDTPFTPAISLVVALRESIRRIEREGLEKLLKRTESLARYVRERFQKEGFELFAKRPSNGVTAVKVPQGLDGEKVLDFIREKEGISIAGGQGEMKGQVIRMAHMGAIRKADVDRGFAALKSALKMFGKEQGRASLVRG